MTKNDLLSSSSQPKSNFIRSRWGLFTGIVYALFGLALTHVCIQNSSAGNKIGEVLRVFLWPGGLPFLFVSKHAMAGGVYVLLYLTNPVAYFLFGFLLGASLSSLRKVIILSIALLLVITGIGYYQGIVAPRANIQERVQRDRETALAKLTANPNDIPTLHNIGVDYFAQQNNPSEGAEYFKKVVQLESATGSYSELGQRSLLYLAIISQRMGRYEDGASYFKMFMESSPKMDAVEINYINEYRQKERKPPQFASETPIQVGASRLPVIIEGRIIAAKGCDKYCSYTVSLLKVIQKRSQPKLDSEITVYRRNDLSQPKLNGAYLLALDFYNAEHPEYGFKVVGINKL